MMRRLLNLIVVLSLFSSCAFHSGMMTANLPADFNQEIVDQAEGQATTVHVFGIGGLDHKHLVTDAKKNLYANYPLKVGEAYANLVVDYRLFPYVVVVVQQVFVTADIVSDPSVENDSLQYFFEPPLNEKGIRILSKDRVWVKANDEIRIVNGKKCEVGRVVRVLGRKRVLISSAINEEKKYGLKKFFLKEENIRFKNMSYYVGQSVPVKIDGYTRFVYIVGINHRFLLLESGSDCLVRSIQETDELIEKLGSSE
jgi:hypothetical protein